MDDENEALVKTKWQKKKHNRMKIYDCEVKEKMKRRVRISQERLSEF